MKKELSKEQKEELTQKVKAYFEAELNQEIGQFDAEFLIYFFAKEMKAHFFNNGLHTAQALLNEQVESFNTQIYALEEYNLD